MTKYNVDPRFNPKTTILGAIIVTIGLFFYVCEHFMEMKKDVNDWVNIPMLGLGCILIVAPDRWVSIVSSAFAKFFKKIFG